MNEKNYFGVFLTVAILIFCAWYVSETNKTILELNERIVVLATAPLATPLSTTSSAIASPTAPANKSSAPVSTAPANIVQTYTAGEVAVNNTATKCWSIVNDQVYDLTKWIPLHPGGESKIKAMCGKDSTSAFEGKHGGEEKPEAILAKYKIGDLAR